MLGPRNQITQSENKSDATTRHYTVIQTSAYDSATVLVSVSAETGRITSITERVPSVYKAVLTATYYCEGEVHMPQKASWPDGFELVNEPGPDQKDKRFQFTVSTSLGGQFMLKSRWVNAPSSNRSENVAKRLEELRKERNDHFKKNGEK